MYAWHTSGIPWRSQNSFWCPGARVEVAVNHPQEKVGTDPRSSGEQQVLLNVELPLQS